MLELTEINLYFDQLPSYLDQICILHVTDMHIHSFIKHIHKLRDVMDQGCDMFVLTGDCCYQLRLGNPFYGQDQDPYHIGLSKQGLALVPQSKQALTVCREILNDFRCPLGVFAVQGNHDPDEFMDELAQLGVTVLANQTTQIIASNGERFNLCGIRCYGRKAVDIPQAILDMDPSLFTVALSHYPENAEPLAAAGVDLILSGHTHGGQICMPNGRPVITHSRTNNKYAFGLQYIADSAIYTSRGLGYSFLPIRSFCPPEITRITLFNGKPDKTSIRQIKL